MKTKRILSTCLMLFAFCLINVMATSSQTESVTSMGTDKTMVKNNHLRPFEGTVSYTLSETHVSYGSGIATHMGRLTAVSDCKNIEFGYDTFTAADGSEATMRWDFEYISEDYTYGSGTWEWIGGTGRFEDISGNGTFTADLTTTLNLHLTGTIAY